ncbi:protein NLRC3 [Labeo rohita]|uniref:protein NLRC3 n=1 Tax=Labeo rohita TaxID=84645 RepID=UPI0021E2A009|nr:protein NLRC3 [Labeo rohita]
MCHIPVFCWISATVLEKMLSRAESGEIPKTLTQMYTHFLILQTNIKHEKDYEKKVTDEDMILKLGKLAFQQLVKGNLIFYDKDLRECGIDVTEASVYSGLCTQIFREEFGLYQGKVFSFVHLSIQEHLAALYAHLSCTIKKRNVVGQLKQSLLSKILNWKKYSSLSELHQRAVDEALQSKNGHLDLFLRFLLGLSLESNQTLLQELLTQTGSCSYNKEETVQFIKQKIRENPSPEKFINLFHCLNELGDDSLMQEIQRYLKSGKIRETKLSSSQWSALVYVLLTSEQKMDVFDLKQFIGSQHTADEVLQYLLPVVKESRSVRLCGCNLTAQSCESLSSALQSSNCVLRELDLSNNDLQDSGVMLLSDGLKNCKLEMLRLSGCMVTEEGCGYLFSALSSNPSHLRELDLSYNHPGDSGVKLLSEKLDDPNCSLDKLNVDYGGESRITAGLKKYACFLTLDPNTANNYFSLSEENRTVTCVMKNQSYPDHPDRFDYFPQVLCRESVCGRCYWEIEWSGRVFISVSYKSISRKGRGDECAFGNNDQSWSLNCSHYRYSFIHNKIKTELPVKPIISRIGVNDDDDDDDGIYIIGVYVDESAGTLSFYSVSDTMSLIHTEQITFTQTLCAGFWVGAGSSLKLC